MEFQLPAEIVFHITKYILPKKIQITKKREIFFEIYEYDDYLPPLQDIMTIFYSLESYEKTNYSITDTIKNMRLTCKSFADSLDPSFAYTKGIGSFMRKQYIQIILRNFNLARKYLIEDTCRNRIDHYLKNGTEYYGKYLQIKCNPFIEHEKLLKAYPTIILDNDKFYKLIENKLNDNKNKNYELGSWRRMRLMPYQLRFLA